MINLTIGRYTALQQAPAKAFQPQVQFKGIEDEFNAMSPVQQFGIALKTMSRTSVKAVREGVLNACESALTLEGTFNVVPHFKTALANQNLIGTFRVKDFADAAPDLDTKQLIRFIDEIIVERSKNETDPTIKERYQDHLPTAKARLGLS